MSQPRYAEFIRLKSIVDGWVEIDTVDGNVDDETYNGGGANG